MNELFFVLQLFLILLFTYGAFRLGEGALLTAVSMHALLANLFVLKQISFFGFEVSCSDGFAVGSILGLNLLREHFGKKSAKKAISICFFFMIFFVVMSQMHLLFSPSIYDTSHSAYKLLLSPAPRLLIASLFVFYLIQHFDVRLFSWISQHLPRFPFSVRSTISLTISQLFDTILFSFLGLYGLVTKLSHIIFISFFLKIFIILTLGPLMTFFKRVEKNEPI